MSQDLEPRFLRWGRGGVLVTSFTRDDSDAMDSMSPQFASCKFSPRWNNTVRGGRVSARSLGLKFSVCDGLTSQVLGMTEALVPLGRGRSQASPDGNAVTWVFLVSRI